MSNFYTSSICEERKHCNLCRSSKAWRKSISNQFDIDEEFECHIGLTEEDLNKKLPSPINQVKNLTSAVARICKNLIKQDKIVADDETIKHRTETCKSCENLRYINDSYRCIKCACYLTVKISLKSESCEKW